MKYPSLYVGRANAREIDGGVEARASFALNEAGFSLVPLKSLMRLGFPLRLRERF
jgi:hypothetical protein